MKTLYLMRHGETQFNAQHRIQGWCDSPLTERGIEQARAMGARLHDRGVRIDHAYCSTAERAADTLEIALAEIVGGAASAPSARLLNEADPNLGAHLASGPLGTPAPLPYERLKGLREMSYGNLEAQQDFLAENDPEKCRTFYLQFGGESSDTTLERMVATLTAIMMRPGHESVLAVGHGGANFNFLRAVTDPMPVLNAGWGNCTTCVYAFDETHAREAPDGNGAGPWRLTDVARL